MEKPGKISVEHIVLGAVLVVVLAIGGWFLLRPGASTASAQKGVEPAASRPTEAANADLPQTSAPVLPLKPTKFDLVPMTKKAYLAAGNKICARMNAGTKALGDFPAAPKAEAAFVTKTVAITEKARKLLVALPAPTASAAKLAAYYGDIAKLDAIGRSLAKSLVAGDTAKAKALEQKLATQSDKANAEFTAFGLTVCGTD